MTHEMTADRSRERVGPGPSRLRGRHGALGALVALVAVLGGPLLASALSVASRAHAEPLPAQVTRIAVLTKTALAVGERVDATRSGRVAALPTRPRLRWTTRLGSRIDHPIAVAGDGALLLVSALSGSYAGETAVIALSPDDGAVRTATKIEPPASGVTVLHNGTRVVISVRGEAFGVAPDGQILFRTPLPGDAGSAPRAGVVPLPDGGLAVARRSELHQLDAHGAVVGSVRLELTPALAARGDGEIVGVTPSGEVFGWRAGTAPKPYGSFGEQTIVPVGGNLCAGGLALDEHHGSGHRRDRVICATEGFVDELDLVTHRRRTLLGRAALPFRTPVAVSNTGAVAVVAAGGTLVSLSGAGEHVLADVPGSIMSAPGGDGGVFLPPAGEVAPLVASDGSMVFGAAEGTALWHVGGSVQRLTRCSGAGTVAGIAPGPAGSVYVACADGKVELWIDSA